MKRLLISLVVGLLLVTACSADKNNIWGVWNLGDKNDARYNAEISLGYYLRTGSFIEIEPNDNGKQEIVYDGGSYTIKDIQGKGGTYYFVLECTTPIKSASGNWKNIKVIGVVAMHFISKDEVWFEVLYNDKRTDPMFPKSDFPGNSLVYWRAQKVDHPIQNSGEGE